MSEESLEQLAATFWQDEAIRVPNILDDMMRLTASTQQRTYPFAFDVAAAETKAVASEALRLTYRNLIWQVIRDLASEGLHLLDIQQAEFVRSATNPTGVDQIKLTMLFYRVH